MHYPLKILYVDSLSRTSLDRKNDSRSLGNQIKHVDYTTYYLQQLG